MRLWIFLSRQHHFRVFNQDGFTALMMVAQEGHDECMSILLDSGAEVNKTRAVSALCAY